MENMNEVISEIGVRVGDLETLILSIQSSVQHSINLMIGLIGVAIALLSLTGLSYIKNKVSEKFEDFYEKNKKELISDIIRDRKNNRNQIIIQPTLIMGAVPYQDYECTYGILEDRFVYIDMKILFKGVGRKISVLPVKLRPISDIRFIVSTHNAKSGAMDVGHVEILKDGSIIILSNYYEDTVIHLQNIVFKTDTDLI